MSDAAMRAAMVIALLLLGVPAQLAAQASPPDGEAAGDDVDRERARVAIDEGNAAFAAHDYTLALSRFRAAFDAVPLDQIRFNVARCLERLARFREAADEYRAAAASTHLSEGERARAASELEVVEARLGTLAVRGETGAAIHIDDRWRCAIPCDERLDPGPHRLEDDRGQARTVTLRRGETETLRWAPPTATATRSEETPPAARHQVGALAIAGGVIAAIGVGGTIGFGVRQLDLEGQFDLVPSHAIADEGELMAGLANASLGLSILGAGLVLLDLLLSL